MFKPVKPQVNFAELEEEILEYWKKNNTFEKSVEKEAPNGDWTFLDGPPFVTGLPHYGSLLSSLPKDMFGRYFTMKGYHVRRVWGWDGHGLPIENKVENELQIKRKKDIEETVGIKTFIDKCKEYVNQVSGEWEWYVDHIARWVDFKHAYKTWDTPYMESVMWVFKQMYDKGFVYKGLRVSLYCPHCATPISNFEVAMDVDNYKELTDSATTYKYKLKSPHFAEASRGKQISNGKSTAQNLKLDNTYILAWSTTPWNKIVTPALAVDPKLTYVKAQQKDEKYILAKSTLKMLEGEYKILEEFKGDTLIGLEFEPHYDYYPIEPGEKAFVVVGGDFVTADEGTGVVTIAAYGEEDLKVMKEENIHIEMHLDEEGTIKPEVPLFGGMYYLKANKFVNEDLEKRGLVYKDENLPHNVPLCWRCHTRLYHAPIDAWYVNVQGLKKQMAKTNELVNWFPTHFKHGRFLKSLENAPDWNISRNRYWGSPVPVWECACGERFVPGSIKELEEASGKTITDLHKPEIDEVTVLCKKCGKQAHRVPEVLDSWIEAGSASFGERHYPFGEQPPLESFYPPDFISEYTGQIRAWFYVLHVIANALNLRSDGQNLLSRNVSVTGVILGTDGRKMSKNFKNYPDPKEMLQKFGGDALRLYLLGSPVMNGEDILISEEQYKMQVRGMMLILWNTYNFFVTYANVDSWSPQTVNTSTSLSASSSNNILDKWVVSLLNQLIEGVTKDLEGYDTVSAIEKLKKFTDDFSTWYIRRSRDRVGPSAQDNEDKKAFYATSHHVLITFCKVLAPFTPFLAEAIYQNLTGEESVHLAQWPVADSKFINTELITHMEQVRKIVELGHSKRKEAEIRVKQPLQQLTINNLQLTVDVELTQLIKDELNVKEVQFEKRDGELAVALDTEITEELKAEGEARDIIRKIQEERKKLGTNLEEKVEVMLPDWPEKFAEHIKKKALVTTLTKSDTFSVKKL